VFLVTCFSFVIDLDNNGSLIYSLFLDLVVLLYLWWCMHIYSSIILLKQLQWNAHLRKGNEVSSFHFVEDELQAP
jgi:hypothetical protein